MGRWVGPTIPDTLSSSLKEIMSRGGKGEGVLMVR